MDTFAARRRAHREEDVELGKRSPGLSIRMHQIMWARWFEVAVEHELEARAGFRDIVAKPNSDSVLREFRASLVTVSAAAYTVEALYGDFKYLIPAQPRSRDRHKQLRHAFRAAFGVSGTAEEAVGRELAWLFNLRNDAAHPYTEAEAPAQHPAGINTGAEHSRFNALTSGRAVDTALMMMDIAAWPPETSDRWVRRWAAERSAHQVTIRQLRDQRDGQPLA